MTVFRTVTPEYFSALEIRIVPGRGFTGDDRGSSEQVAILGESLAHRCSRPRILWYDGCAQVDRTLAHDRRHCKRCEECRPEGSGRAEYYFLWRKGPDAGRRRAHLILRSEADRGGLASMVRAELAGLDPTLPLPITTMRQNLG